MALKETSSNRGLPVDGKEVAYEPGIIVGEGLARPGRRVGVAPRGETLVHALITGHARHALVGHAARDRRVRAVLPAVDVWVEADR